MGVLDQFRSRWDQRKKQKSAPKKHVAGGQDATAAFKAVPAAGRPAPQKGGGDRKKPDAKRERRGATGEAYRILLRPLVTEKSTRLTSLRQYVFAVGRSANKIEVRRAVRALYGVDPARVNVLNVRGKAVRYGRTTGRTSAWRKAVVTLPQGQKIDVLE